MNPQNTPDSNDPQVKAFLVELQTLLDKYQFNLIPYAEVRLGLRDAAPVIESEEQETITTSGELLEDEHESEIEQPTGADSATQTEAQ